MVQMDRASKRQKTVRLRNLLPHCSASAFAAFCAAAKRGELPTLSTRKEVRDARDDNVDVTTPFGPLLTKLEITSASGKAIIYDGVHPLSYLYCAAQKKNFGTLLEQAFAECPCSHQRFVCNLFMGLCNRFSQPALAVRVSHEVARGWFAVPGPPAVAAWSPEVSSALPWSPAVRGLCSGAIVRSGTLLEQAFAECPCSHQRFVCNLFMGLCNRFSQPALAVQGFS